MSDNQRNLNNNDAEPNRIRRRPSRTVVTAPDQGSVSARRTETSGQPANGQQTIGQSAAGQPKDTYRIHVNPRPVSPQSNSAVPSRVEISAPPEKGTEASEQTKQIAPARPVQQNQQNQPQSRTVQQNHTPAAQPNRAYHPAPTAQNRSHDSSVDGIAYSVGKRSKSAKRHTTSGAPPGSGNSKRSAQASGPSTYREYDMGESAGGSMLKSVLKAVAYIVFLLVAVTFLSYYAISCGNDCFAFVKSSEEITVDIPEYATISDVARILDENDVINYPTIFKIYAKLRKKADVEFVAGAYTVSPSMSYDTLIREFRNVENSDYAEISITFSEGMTLDQMLDVFIENGIGTRDGFYEQIREGDFSDFWFIKELDDNGMDPNRTYRLEGYLYPDTYRFYQNSTEYQALYKMLSNFNDKFAEEYKLSCESLGMTVDQVVTLASMIEAEAKYVTEFSTISSVFHNRLNNPSYETVGLLQSDATIQYFLDARKAELSSADLANENPYNTYVYKGLPPGPICNPTLNAIDAALYPEDTEYYYFVAQSNGYSLFATTAAEQAENKKIARGES